MCTGKRRTILSDKKKEVDRKNRVGGKKRHNAQLPLNADKGGEFAFYVT